MATGEPDASTAEPHFPVGRVLPLRFTQLGQPDANRYPFTVTFRAPSSPDGSTYYRACNGVLFASNLVLTAAHCVCTPSRGETIRFDGSECAAKTEVHVYDYPLAGTGTWEVINGNISIHPGFQITLDAQGAVVTSNADLAIIRLERPVPPNIRPVPLATEEVKTGEVLSVVGFGWEEGDTGRTGMRRSVSQEKVQTPAGDDRLFFGSMEQASYKGDTGGPCLRETKQGIELVGISQRGLGLRSAFTRIGPYREWLGEQLRLASERH